jgi:hypothetical protein
MHRHSKKNINPLDCSNHRFCEYTAQASLIASPQLPRARDTPFFFVFIFKTFDHTFENANAKTSAYLFIGVHRNRET